MKLLAAILVILALFAASTQCIAECLAPVKVPPCHRHAQGQDKAPADSCLHPRLIAHKQPLTDYAIAIPADLPPTIELAEVALLEVTPAIGPPPGNDPSPAVLRL
jgi:hypothetical protein